MFSSASATPRTTVNAAIRWPSGLVQQFHDLPINHRIWVEEGAQPSRIEPFRKPTKPTYVFRDGLESSTIETWLLSPVPAPNFSPTGKPALVHSTDDKTGAYNVLYRYLFDRHRDMTLPTSFLIDSQGDIVKVYQGPVEQAGRRRFHPDPSNHRAVPCPSSSFSRQRRNL